MTKWLFAALLICLGVIACVTPADAQVLYGSIVGTVEDPSGALVPGAQVEVTNVGTGQARSATADEAGNFTIPNLQPGTYNVKLTASGFRTLTREGIIVRANEISRANARMEVGQVTEQVLVTAEASALQTDKADTHTTITSGHLADAAAGVPELPELDESGSGRHASRVPEFRHRYPGRAPADQCKRNEA